jgi:hypothetical protein
VNNTANVFLALIHSSVNKRTSAPRPHHLGDNPSEERLVSARLEIIRRVCHRPKKRAAEAALTNQNEASL